MKLSERGRKIVRALAFTLFGFALGITTATYTKGFRHGPGGHHPGKFSEKRMERIIGHYTRRLELTNEQTSQVRHIIETRHKEMKALHKEVRPKFQKIRKETENEIRKILTPEQIPAFEEMQERFKKRMSRKHKKRR